MEGDMTRGGKTLLRKCGVAGSSFSLLIPNLMPGNSYAELLEISLPLRIALCENLGYPDECILIRDIQSPPWPTKALYSLVIGVF